MQQLSNIAMRQEDWGWSLILDEWLPGSWLALAVAAIELLLLFASLYPVPQNVHMTRLVWATDLREAGYWLAVAVTAAGFWYAAAILHRLPPRHWFLQSLAVASAGAFALFFFHLQDPHAVVPAAILFGTALLPAAFSRQHDLLYGLLRIGIGGGGFITVMLLWPRAAFHNGWFYFIGPWTPIAITWGLGLVLPLAAVSSVYKAHERVREAAAYAAKRTAHEGVANTRDPHAFDSLVGVQEAVEAIKDAVELPLLRPAEMARYKVSGTKGILLVGPPGTGKTALARAAAAYCGCAFRAVGQGDLLRPHVGSSEAAVKELFTWARDNTPSILFIDEIDAIAGHRDGQSLNRPSDLILRCLLVELDGFQPLKGVLVIAATNVPDLLDPALRRPGRFDREIEIGLPDADGRREIFDVYLRGRPVSGDIDTVELARETEGFSPAEIAGIANTAALLALKRGLPICQADLYQALRK